MYFPEARNSNQRRSLYRRNRPEGQVVVHLVVADFGRQLGWGRGHYDIVNEPTDTVVRDRVDRVEVESKLEGFTGVGRQVNHGWEPHVFVIFIVAYVELSLVSNPSVETSRPRLSQFDPGWSSVSQ